jgi:hypothetical protein
MKAQFLKIAGVNSEEEFYNMFPTEESFFRAHPEAQQMAQGGATYPYPGQATADEFFNYGMQGKGAGTQIPVETWFAYGGFTSKPSATLVHYGDGGMGQYSHPSNYGAFPAFAQKGNQVQGGGIDAATSSRLKNFLSGIQANTQKALNDQAMEEAMQMNQELMPQLIAQYGAEMNNNAMYQSELDNLRADRQNKMGDFMGSVVGAVNYETDKRIKQKMYDDFEKKLNDLAMKNKANQFSEAAQTVPDFNPIPENMAKLGGSLKKYQGAGQTGNTIPSSSDIEIRKVKYNEYLKKKPAYDKRRADRTKANQDLKAALDEKAKIQEQYNNEYSKAKTPQEKINVDLKYQLQIKNVESKEQAARNLLTLSSNISNYAVLEKDPTKAVYSTKAVQWTNKNPITPLVYEEGKPTISPITTDPSRYEPKITLTEESEFDTGIEEPLVDIEQNQPENQKPVVKTTTETTGTTQQQTAPGTAPGQITGTGKPGVRYTPGTQQKTTGTGTTNNTQGTMDPKEKAVKDLAIAYGQDPDQVWTRYQALMNSYGTMGTGTGYPYMVNAPDYRYRRTRTPYPFAGDVGRMPTPEDIQAMQSAAEAQGYGLKVTEKKRLFGKGPRKIVIETTFNPNTGKVEETPKVERESDSTWHPPMAIPGASTEPTKNYDFVQAANSDTPVNKEEFMKGKIAQDIADLEEGIPLAEPRQGFKYGGLNRFLPKHDMLGQTGGYEGAPVNPIFDTLADIQEEGTTGMPGMLGLTGKKTGAKSTYKRKMKVAPWAADATLTGISALTALAQGDEERALENETAQRMRGDYLFKPSGGKDLGTDVPTGALTGTLGANQYGYAQDSGYMPGKIMDRGGSIAYSDWSQTPVNGYYGIPTGEMTMYPHWTQAPVMQMGGVPSTEQYLTDEEIAEIIQMGGQVEYLD